MRFSSALLVALPALALAEEQVPLFEKVKGFLNKAKDAVTAAVPVPTAPSPLDAGAAKVAAAVQHELTLENWKDTLSSDPRASAPTSQDWLVYITGGNTTCYGFCGNATKAWNTSLPLLASKPSGPKFAVLDCETQPILCNSWSVGPPSLYYFQIPKPLADQSAPAITARYITLNRTSTTVDTFKTLVLDKEYEKTEPYEGVWHPFNGQIQQFGIAPQVGYVLWAFSKMPSWMPMILISVLSRSFMGRRTAPRAPPAAQPAQ